MHPPNLDPPRILFLFSDTGGGHRSAAEAIIEAIHLDYGDAIHTEMVDFFKEYSPRPFNNLPGIYPKLVRLPRAWGLGYRLSNGPRRVNLLLTGTWPYVRGSIRKMIAKRPCDLIVSVHPLLTDPVLRALGDQRPIFVTVVTDMVTTHAFWYSRKTDLCVVASQEAYRRALRSRLNPEQVKLIGLPVAERFTHPAGDPQVLRARLGWPQDRPIVLLIGGGDGMGPLEKTARAIAGACPSVGLVVITGRNQELKERLSARQWPIPTFIYGFVREMPDFMRAANILVTKAGPGTISEALIANLPMILYSRLPGQEDGNVTYVVSEKAGVWAPKPEQVTQAIQNWLDFPDQYNQAVAACQRLARPQAAHQIAHLLAQQLDVRPKSEFKKI